MPSPAKNKYIIDTNIFGLAHQSSHNHHQLKKFITDLNYGKDCLTSCFVYSELLSLHYAGNQSHELIAILDRLMESEFVMFDTLEKMQDIANLKSLMRFFNRKNRTVDWYIAAQCIATESILVTANKKDYDYIPGLKAKFYDQPNQRWY